MKFDETENKRNAIKEIENDFTNFFMSKYNEIIKSKLLKRDELPKKSGIYIFYEIDNNNEIPIYVGRTNKIRDRIQYHTRMSSQSDSASFAFILAKSKFGETNLTRKELEKVQKFIEIFNEQKKRLNKCMFRCIEMENDILQTMFEPYLAYKLGTYPINNTFENH